MLAASLLTCGLLAVAQPPRPPDETSVTVRGVARAKRTPERLRLQLLVLARGKDFDAAVAALRDRLTAVGKELAGVAADPELELGEAVRSTFVPPYQQNLQQMAAARSQRQAKPNPKTQYTPQVIVGGMLRAEWPLDPDPVKAQRLGGRVREKVAARGRDWAGLAELGKPTDAEQELADLLGANENGGFPGGRFGDDPFGRGRDDGVASQLTCLTRADAGPRAKLLAEAFKKAKAEAEEIAAAVGGKVAGLRTVSLTRDGRDGRFDDDPAGYVGRTGRDELGQTGLYFRTPPPLAAVPDGMMQTPFGQPIPAYQVEVSAVFRVRID